MASPSPAPTPDHLHHHHQQQQQQQHAQQHLPRLPPVTLPPENLLDAPSAPFNAARRQSINSDPVLHAFSAPADGTSAPAPATVDHQQYHLHAPPLPPPTLRRTSTDDATSSSQAGGSGGMGTPDGQQQPYPYGSSFPPSGQQQPPPSHPHYQHPVGPAPAYRFGGPSQSSTPQDTPSYFDYSMRRHSLSNNINGTSSPPRHLTADASLPSPGLLKRKTSGDAEGFEESYIQAVRYGQQPVVGAPPNPKRRTSSLTFDKLNNLSLSDQARRDSYGASSGPVSPWEDDRRGSSGSYASAGSQSYGAPAYQPVHSPYDQQPPPPSHFPPPSHQQQQQQHPGPAWDSQQVGPRGSISRGPYEDMNGYQRRPSIPSVSQMMQHGPGGGGGQYYSAAPSVPSPHAHAHQQPHYPPPPPNPNHSRGLTQPAVMVSSVPHTPTEIEDGHSRTASSASYSSIPPGGVPPGPAPWARSSIGSVGGGGPPPGPQRQNSASSLSLDPMSAYAPGQQGPPSKDSPYQRSPELRVSHKLAERKRRKEMAQLFDDLRDSLPFDKGLKASKWEILSKAIEYVGELKVFAKQLEQENHSMREHYGLGPSSIAAPGTHDHSGDLGDAPPGSSHSSHAQGHSSHEASPAPPGTASGPPPPPHSHQPWLPSAPSPAPSNPSRPTTAQPRPPSSRSHSQHPLSPHTTTFPPHAQHQPHPQFAYQVPPQQQQHPYQKGGGPAQPSPPLSQVGAGSPPLPTPNSAQSSPTTTKKQVAAAIAAAEQQQ
ncbi:hypothetical protein JCM6882_003662 [Rhodosporidiobolus microsporus]